MNAICVVVDRLHAGYLGAYGNTWVRTPEIDRLAAESLTFDAATIDGSDLAGLYRAFWQGRHALESPAAADESLPRLLAAAGVTTELVTDETFAHDPWLRDQVDEHLLVARPKDPRVAAGAHETHLAELFATAIDQLAGAEGSLMLWVHAGSLGHTWDAPLELRAQFADEEDAPPYAGVEVPRYVLDADFDPDQRVSLSHAYAGQVAVLDSCLGGLMDFLRQDPTGRETLLVLMSARGIALGEHRRVGAWDDALDGELVQIPWLIRLPDGRAAGTRSHALVQPPDLAATLLGWWNVAMPSATPPRFGRSLWPILRDEREPRRPCSLIAARSGARGLRTPAWYYRRGQPLEGDDAPLEERLYAKPDDRWEVNEVSARCPSEIASLERLLIEGEQAIRSGTFSALGPLDEALTNAFR